VQNALFASSLCAVEFLWPLLMTKAGLYVLIFYAQHVHVDTPPPHHPLALGCDALSAGVLPPK